MAFPFVIAPYKNQSILFILLDMKQYFGIFEVRLSEKFMNKAYLTWYRKKHYISTTLKSYIVNGANIRITSV